MCCRWAPHAAEEGAWKLLGGHRVARALTELCSGSVLKPLLVAAGMPLPVGIVARRDLPARDPRWSHSSAALCPSQWPFGHGLLPPLPASSLGSLPGALGPTAQKRRSIYLLIQFLHQLFLPDSVFPERVVVFFFSPGLLAGQGREISLQQGRCPSSFLEAWAELPHGGKL